MADRDRIDACPRCGGEADRGFDREAPPNPYVCSKCEEAPDRSEVEAALAELHSYSLAIGGRVKTLIKVALAELERLRAVESSEVERWTCSRDGCTRPGTDPHPCPVEEYAGRRWECRCCDDCKEMCEQEVTEC